MTNGNIPWGRKFSPNSLKKIKRQSIDCRKNGNKMKKLTREEKFMREAIKSAQRGARQGEVPIGAVVVYEDKVVARGYNRRAKLQLASAHAEMMAIDKACKVFHSWRLPEGCELYVTLEPCPMCMGASLNARVDKIYFGAYEQKGRSLTNELAESNLLNHKTEVVGGVLQEKCEQLLSGFFIALRQKQKEEKARLKQEQEIEQE